MNISHHHYYCCPQPHVLKGISHTTPYLLHPSIPHPTVEQGLPYNDEDHRNFFRKEQARLCQFDSLNLLYLSSVSPDMFYICSWKVENLCDLSTVFEQAVNMCKIKVAEESILGMGLYEQWSESHGEKQAFHVYWSKRNIRPVCKWDSAFEAFSTW